MKPLCDLEECHRVKLGAQYKSNACAMFINYMYMYILYITKEQQQDLLGTVSKVNFFSIQCTSRQQH